MRWFIGVGEPLSDPTDVNFPLNKQAFVTRHSMDMKCEDIAGNFEDFLGYHAEDLVGKSYYEFHHAADGVILSKSLKARKILMKFKFLGEFMDILVFSVLKGSDSDGEIQVLG